LIPIAVFLLYTASASASVITRPMIHFGLVGYWSFDVGKGGDIVYDMSGFGNHGSTTNMNVAQDWVDGPPGLGTALDFDGVDDEVQLGDNPTLTPPTQISVSAWVNSTAAEADMIFTRDDNSARIWRLSVEADGDPAFQVFNTSGFAGTAVGTSDATDGNWHFITGTWDNVTVRIYFDGVEEGTAIRDGTISQSTGAISYIGRVQAGFQSPGYFTGQIDDVRIYSRALAPEEVKRLYNNTRPKISTVPMSDGLIGYWSFDVGKHSINAIDQSGKGNNGTLTNMDATSDWVDGPPGLGTALDFDGTDDFVNVGDPSNGSLDFGDNDDFSIAGWVNNSDTGDGRLITKKSGTGGDTGYLVTINGSGTLALDVDPGGYRLTSGTNLSANTWHHFVFLWDADGIAQLYINGVLDTNGASTAAVGDLSNNRPFRLGAESDGEGPFQGQLDEVRIYNRVLTPAEVTRLYNLTRPTLNSSQNNRLTNGLVGMWSFNGPDLTGAKALDSSSNGNDGTRTNGPVAVIGKVGQALDFDGVDDRVNLGSPAILDNVFGNGGGTVTAWINPRSDGEGNSGTIADKAQGGIAGWVFIVCSSTYICSNTNNTLAFDMNFVTQDGRWHTAADTITYNEWQHVAVTYATSSTAVDPTFYINGTVSATTENVAPSGGQTDDSSAGIDIGNRTIEDVSFDGKIDEVRIYDRILSSNEIRRLYNMGR